MNTSEENKEPDDQKSDEIDNKSATSAPETNNAQETGNSNSAYVPEDTPGESSTDINSLAGGNEESGSQVQAEDKSMEPKSTLKNLKVETNAE